jgi:hypothetical protein
MVRPHLMAETTTIDMETEAELEGKEEFLVIKISSKIGIGMIEEEMVPNLNLALDLDLDHQDQGRILDLMPRG